uniref:F-box domain-containing protein n=1 Tax=Oryza glumipatula TaxID=40148 RepID=A0A0E0B7T3_9ORYZ
MYFLAPNWSLQIMLAEGGSKLGFGAVKFLYLKLWVRKSDSDSTASWVMRKRIKLCMFIPPPHPPLRQLEALFDRLIAWSGLLGFTEDGSVAFLQTPNGVIMLQLDTMEFKLVLPMERLHWVYPHSGFYLTATATARRRRRRRTPPLRRYASLPASRPDRPCARAAWTGRGSSPPRVHPRYPPLPSPVSEPYSTLAEGGGRGGLFHRPASRVESNPSKLQILAIAKYNRGNHHTLPKLPLLIKILGSKLKSHCPSFLTMANMLPDDALIEILLHLPKHPTCLLRASLVCKHWRYLIRDNKFIKRFRALHQTPPVLGIFTNSTSIPRFLPIGNPPECVTAGAFSLPDPYWHVLGCRHSRVLLISSSWNSLQVWNPMTGNRYAVPVTPDVNPRINYGRVPESHAAVLCAAGHNDHGDCGSCPFFIVWVFTNIGYAYISRYSSEKDTWDMMASSPAPSEVDSRPSILVGNVIYWPLKSKHILAFELSTSRLYHIECPSETHSVYRRNVHIMKAEDGGLGLAAMTGFNLQLWALEIDSGGVTGWVLRKTIELGAVLPLEVPSIPLTDSPLVRRPPVRILGLVEEDDLFFIWTAVGVFAVQLKSLQFKKVFEADVSATFYPYTAFYTTGADIDMLLLQFVFCSLFNPEHTC